MKKIILLLVVIQSISLKAQNELLHQWSFTHSNNYSNGNVISSDVIKDNSNHLFIVGTFSGTVDFDKSNAQYLITASGTNDGFLAHYDDAGNLIWVKNFTCTGSLLTMKLMLHNNIITLIGEYTNTIDFDNSTTGDETTSLGNYTDIFIAQFQLNGNFIQNKTFGNDQPERINDVKYFNNELILTGSFRNTVDFDLSNAVFNMVSSGSTDIFLVKYTQNLDFVTGFKIGGTFNDSPSSLCVDATGSISILGSFTGTVDFNPSSTATFNLTNNTTYTVGATDIFLAKFSNSGSFNTAANIGATGGSAIAKLDSNGDYIIAGTFKNQSDFDPTAGSYLVTPVATNFSTIFYSKYSSNLNLIWINKIEGSNSNSTLNDMIVTTDNSIVLTGRILNSFDFDPSPTSTNLTGPAGFYASYNSTGNLIYAYGGQNISNGKLLDGTSQNFYLVGSFIDGVDFDGTLNGENWLFSSGTTSFVGKYNYSGELNYVYRIGNIGIGGISLRADTDSNGNVYKAGTTNSSIDIDPSAGLFTTGIPDLNDFFISKHSSDGNFLWAKMIKGSPFVTVSKMNTDSNGNIFVFGNFMGTPDFDPSINVHTLVNNSGIQNCFLAKYDSDGNFIWVYQIGGVVTAWSKIQFDDNGNVYFTGTYKTSFDFNPSNPGVHMLNSASPFLMSVFYAKVDINGTLVWVKELQASSDIGINPFAIYVTSNNIYLCGEFLGTIDFDPSPATELVTHQYHMGNSYILKLDTNGNKVWLSTFANQDTTVGTAGFQGVSTFGLYVDDSDNIYCTSYGMGTVDYDPSPTTAVQTSTKYVTNLTKYDATGNLLWLKTLPSNNAEENGFIWRGNLHMLADNNNNILIAGTFLGDVDFDPSTSVYPLQNESLSNPALFVAQYTQEGDFLSAVRADGNHTGAVNSATINENQELVLAGSVTGDIDLDFGSGTQIVNNSSFIVKYNIGILNTDEFSNSNTLFVYPNPVKNTLSLHNPSQLSFDINILDISGKNLFSAVNERSNINVENLSEGVYFIQLINQEKGINKTIKFIKE